MKRLISLGIACATGALLSTASAAEGQRQTAAQFTAAIGDECLRDLEARIDDFYQHVIGDDIYTASIDEVVLTYDQTSHGMRQRAFTVTFGVNEDIVELHYNLISRADGTQACHIGGHFAYHAR
jgi:hypothetical protein